MFTAGLKSDITLGMSKTKAAQYMKRRNGNKKLVTVIVRWPPELKKAVAARAKRSGVTLNRWIFQVVTRKLNHRAYVEL